MLKQDMTCTCCIFGEPAGSFGAMRCVRYPESTLKRPTEHCGEGEFEEGDGFSPRRWGEWESQQEK